MLTRDDILNYALALPPGDRKLVAAALQDSLEPEPNATGSLVRNEFFAELQRRSATYRAGQNHARPATEVMAELFQRQADESSP
jgi:putative addiction module component (TIGR02574 family)